MWSYGMWSAKISPFLDKDKVPRLHKAANWTVSTIKLMKSSVEVLVDWIEGGLYWFLENILRMKMLGG